MAYKMSLMNQQIIRKIKKKLQYFTSSINYYPSTCEIIEKLKLHQTKPNLNLKCPQPLHPYLLNVFFYFIIYEMCDNQLELEEIMICHFQCFLIYFMQNIFFL